MTNIIPRVLNGFIEFPHHVSEPVFRRERLAVIQRIGNPIRPSGGLKRIQDLDLFLRPLTEPRQHPVAEQKLVAVPNRLRLVRVEILDRPAFLPGRFLGLGLRRLLGLRFVCFLLGRRDVRILVRVFVTSPWTS